MTLHFVVTLKLKTVIKKSDRRSRRSGAGSYPTVTLLRLQLQLNLNVSSSSGKNNLLRGSGSELRLQQPVFNGLGERNTVIVTIKATCNPILTMQHPSVVQQKDALMMFNTKLVNPTITSREYKATPCI